ncbi:palmitoyl-monogalactosyldiacylglycerol delta-7 desaturase, chloroplastic isoform X2 [Lactuca sativa]|uniref:palmitoyl-monogalactosyldiacylglycerol delta-7 desaturase, chloroplastic isoform X2 n=1 Tax=Lactuca sativa TaxID=4236 RepID=UPI000CD88663|nr:palmitoyl-monogalactosyldiacylglycerol delta-7 desaturase, chloroplastic isoform X2 [Lactuca sativa]
MRNLVTVSNGVNESEFGKILLSDVVVTSKRNLFWGRKWRNIDIQMGVGILAIHLLALVAPFKLAWDAFLFAFWTWVLCGICGVTLSYHRNLAHHSLKLPKWLEYTFAYLGVLSFQKDPHSPTFGFWYSHMGWLFDSGYIIEKYKERNNVEDLKSQVFYRFLQRTYIFHISAFAACVYAYGGFTYFVWAVGVAPTWGYHTTFLVNSACHVWGYQKWETGDLSKNNWWVALLTFGEGWHNNHHAFEYSARHGLEWWQIDFCWYMIRFLEAIGLATAVKLPTEAHKLKKSLSHNKFK